MTAILDCVLDFPPNPTVHRSCPGLPCLYAHMQPLKCKPPLKPRSSSSSPARSQPTQSVTNWTDKWRLGVPGLSTLHWEECVILLNFSYFREIFWDLLSELLFLKFYNATELRETPCDYRKKHCFYRVRWQSQLQVRKVSLPIAVLCFLPPHTL